ncbi:cytochrome P450 [Xylariomycetidae sp. FL0641]|nr:cytochrome P450 [Xylariomycetidae sp. FL0641]
MLKEVSGQLKWQEGTGRGVTHADARDWPPLQPCRGEVLRPTWKLRKNQRCRTTLASDVAVSAVLLIIAYRVFFHPLGSYPGPLLAKLSEGYNAFYAYKGNFHLVTRENHEIYGKLTVVRQTPNKLVFSSVAALRDIYKSERIAKADAYKALGPGHEARNVFTEPNKSLHRARRQLIGQVLTDRSLHVFEPTMSGRIDMFLRKLSVSARESKPVNMSDQSRRLGMDIAGLLGFGYDLDLQGSDENMTMLAVLDAMTPRGYTFYHCLSLRIVRSRTALEKDAKHDLYPFIADHLGPGENGLRQSDLWAEANFFLSAAGETAKTAISAVFFYLSRNPAAYEHPSHEIRSAFTTGSEIRGTTLAGCKYLRAWIDEALRMTPPPAPGILWRQQAAGDNSDQPLIMDGHVIPKGNVFGINTYSLHHNEEYFPEPFTFNPDRWLQPWTSEIAQLMRDAFAPFSVGVRVCAGRSMAYLEINLVLAKTLWYLDFERAPGKLGDVGAGKPGLGRGRGRSDEFQAYDVFNSSHEEPYMIFRPCHELNEEI